MASKIKVDQIEGHTASTVTLPSGQTLDLSSGTVTLPATSVTNAQLAGSIADAKIADLAATKLTGTIADARLPTVPVTKGGTGITAFGTANQVLATNAGANALEFQDAGSGKVLGSARTLYEARTTISSVGATSVAMNFQYPASTNIYMEVAYTKQSGTSVLQVRGHGYYKFTSNTHSFAIWETGDAANTIKIMGIDEHNASRQYFGHSFATVFQGIAAGARTIRAAPGFNGSRSSTGERNPNMYGTYSDTPNTDANSSFIEVIELEVG